MYLKLNADDDVVSFALLHKTDYDPYRKHKNPYVLDYIYTYTNYRNMGHAQSLINKIKTKARIHSTMFVRFVKFGIS